MSFDSSLSIAELREVFAEEVTAAGGTVSDTFDDGTRLFARSILPWVREVRPKDKTHGGVALKATGDDVSVSPYLFREVCRNGAIVAHAIQTEHIENLEWLTKSDAILSVQAAIQACCAEEAFVAAVEQVHVACQTQFDLVLTLLPMLNRSLSSAVLREVMDRFFREGDRSQFGLMNAITSVARDTSDPERRWRLEELGGGVLAAERPTPVPDDAAAELMAQ